MKNNELKKVHEVEIEILDEIDRICKKHKIKYFLVGGTLLGAVRHKGFIPWDDDIDISMLREDYDKFIDICLNTNELSEKYFLHCDETDENYWLPFIKVRKNNTTFNEKFVKDYDTHKGIFVDIFPYDNFKKQKSFFQKLRGFIVRNIADTIFCKKGFKKIENCRRKTAVKIMSLLSIKRLKKIRDNLLLMSNNKNTEYIVSLCGAYNVESETLKKDLIFPLKKIEFEGKKYPCFKNPDYYLSRIYGDYMKLPPEDKRVTHLPVEISFTEGKNIVTKKKDEK